MTLVLRSWMQQLFIYLIRFSDIWHILLIMRCAAARACQELHSVLHCWRCSTLALPVNGNEIDDSCDIADRSM